MVGRHLLLTVQSSYKDCLPQRFLVFNYTRSFSGCYSSKLFSYLLLNCRRTLIKVQDPWKGGGRLPHHPKLMEVVHTKRKDVCQGTMCVGTFLGSGAMGASHEGWQGRASQPGTLPPAPDRHQGRPGGSWGQP